MSSRSPGEIKPNDVASPSAASTEPSIASRPLRSPGRSLRFAAGIALAAWLSLLAVMALISANPVTLNRDQIAHSSFIVTAKVVDRSQGSVDILQEWRRKAAVPSQSVKLSNLEQSGVHNGGTYLMPLTKRPDGTLMVTETRMANGRPLVYPDSEESRKMLANLLAELAEAEKRPAESAVVSPDAQSEEQ